MKFCNKFKYYYLVFLVTVLMFNSCEKDTAIIEEINSSTLISLEDADEVIEEISSVLEEVYSEEEEPVILIKTEIPGLGRYLSDCATKTVEILDGEKIVTIDFGEGCLSKNEKLLKGKLKMSYVVDKSLNKKLVNYGFIDFYVDNKQISGTVSSLKQKNIPEIYKRSIYSEDIMITWEDGSTSSRQGSRVSDLVFVAENGAWWSKVYLISGSWTAVSRSGEVHTVEIVEDLRKELLCRFIVSGKKAISKGNKLGVLDFGDGSCNSSAIFTYSNGTTEEIELKAKENK